MTSSPQQAASRSAEEWSADIELGIAKVQSLVAAVAPGLATERVELVAEGWDNAVYRAGAYLFRFPRRRLAIEGVRTEIAVLGELAPKLPAAIPVPLWSSAGELPYFGYAPVVGEELRPEDLDHASRLSLAERLGVFLSALHAPERLAALRDRLPVDPFGRAELPRRLPRVRQSAEELPPELSGQVLAMLDTFHDLSGADLPEAVVHGDLHPRHVLVSNQELAGVIDWGDLHVGRAAVDFAGYWMFFEGHERRAFVKGYGRKPTPDELRMARLVAFYITHALWRSASGFQLHDLRSSCELAFRRIVAD